MLVSQLQIRLYPLLRAKYLDNDISFLQKFGKALFYVITTPITNKEKRFYYPDEFYTAFAKIYFKSLEDNCTTLNQLTLETADQDLFLREHATPVSHPNLFAIAQPVAQILYHAAAQGDEGVSPDDTDLAEQITDVMNTPEIVGAQYHVLHPDLPDDHPRIIEHKRNFLEKLQVILKKQCEQSKQEHPGIFLMRFYAILKMLDFDTSIGMLSPYDPKYSYIEIHLQQQQNICEVKRLFDIGYAYILNQQYNPTRTNV